MIVIKIILLLNEDDDDDDDDDYDDDDDGDDDDDIKFPFMYIDLKISYAKWWPFCRGLSVSKPPRPHVLGVIHKAELKLRLEQVLPLMSYLNGETGSPLIMKLSEKISRWYRNLINSTYISSVVLSQNVDDVILDHFNFERNVDRDNSHPMILQPIMWEHGNQVTEPLVFQINISGYFIYFIHSVVYAT